MSNSGSGRISSFDMWRNTSMEAFSKSSHHEEDDEDSLTWAAIERLPTYLRIRRGLLAEEDGKAREIIDVNNLGLLERKSLLERLMKIADEDNEKFLLKLKDRMNRIGLEFPTTEVRFEHLNIEAEAYVGGMALPSVFNFSINMLEGFLNYLHILPSRKKPLPILHDVSGIIKPRRMTLLLGSPGSGKTTLLLALVGKLGKDLKVLIEAVENHMPQVIVIDEIGTKLEAMAASTIAQRGIQLVAIAHGVTIENLIMNPSLEMLVGGIQVSWP